MKRFRSGLWIAALALLAPTTWAQTPAGLWKTIDDKTGKEKSLVRIVESAGVFSGKVEMGLEPNAKPDQRCEDCTDSRKGQPLLGMTIIRNMKKGENHWEGGDILDPNNGKVYKLRLSLSADNTKLDVRGYIGAPMFGRSQTWLRVE